MVAWRMVLKTPEYPEGRQLIVIANDLTYLSGSFGPPEYYVFHHASRLARQLRVPRVSGNCHFLFIILRLIIIFMCQLYISCNSGARIGLSEETKALFRVAWNDTSDPDKGFKYIYLTPADHEIVRHTNSVRTQLTEEDGERR